MSNRQKTRKQTTFETLEQLLLMSASAITDGDADDNVLIAWQTCEELNGEGGADTLIALVGDNILRGGEGNDQLISVRGDNVLKGGSGTDTAVYWADRDEFTIIDRGYGILETTNGKRTDYLSEVEYVLFDDGRYSVAELTGNEPREFRTLDGSGNNLQTPELGSNGQQLVRLTSEEYADGIDAPAGANRPSAREISNEIVAQQTVAANDRNLSDLTWLWGQFVDHDIDLTEAAEPHESFNVQVPVADPHFDPLATGTAEIELNRSIYDVATGDSLLNPRQQVNQISAFIDGSNIYGPDDERSSELRTFEGGTLKVSAGNLLPYNEAGLANAGGTGAELFLAGDVRANENAALTSMHTLWVREHNRIAAELSAEDPWLTDEQLYQQAREIVVAELQAITFNEFLPALLGEGMIVEYSGYDANVNPNITNEFSTAAYRLGHSLLSSELQRLNDDGSAFAEGNLPLQDAFFAPQEVAEHGIEPLINGLAHHAASELDTMIVDDVRNFLFGPPGAGGFDLASLNIQRGRDHGLPDYNQVREELGLTAVESFVQITSNTELQQALEDVYGTVENIDLWIGGLAEDHVPGSSLGETFLTIVADQFTRLRDGDRFWYQNLFEGEQLEEIESTTLADVIQQNTSISGLRSNLFILEG